jgi:hypothetical protein
MVSSCLDEMRYDGIRNLYVAMKLFVREEGPIGVTKAEY